MENGEVRQPEAVAEALRELWAVGKFKSKQVVMGVGNQRVVVREIGLPWLPEKELRDSLASRSRSSSPCRWTRWCSTSTRSGEFEQEGRRMIRILLVAAQRVMVDAVVAAAVGAKLEPVGLDLVPFALVRAVGAGDAGMDLEEGGDEAVIDVGAHVTNICVHARASPGSCASCPREGAT